MVTPRGCQAFILDRYMLRKNHGRVSRMKTWCHDPQGTGSRVVKTISKSLTAVRPVLRFRNFESNPGFPVFQSTVYTCVFTCLVTSGFVAAVPVTLCCVDQGNVVFQENRPCSTSIPIIVTVMDLVKEPKCQRSF